MTKLFGTNGIRGIVNQDMNTDLALNIGKSLGTYLKNKIDKPNVAIGTDARFSKDMLKNSVSAGLTSTGCQVLDLGIVPTPCLQYYVKKNDIDSGIIITASHNPPEFNGIKGVTSDGREFTKEIEEKIEKIYFNKNFNLVDWKTVGQVKQKDESIQLYIKGILENINIELIKDMNYKVVLDCGNGAGGLATPKLLKKLGCNIVELFCKPDGSFPGRKSEPLPENLEELIKKVVEEKADFGVAQDGDADRAIFIDNKGSYIWGDKTLSIAGKYIVKKDDIAVTPVTTSSCFEEIIKENHGKIITTKVGSPTVAKVMVENHAVFGGEENGGLIFPELQHSRDSAMTIAKIMEIMAEEKKSLKQLVEEISVYYLIKTKTSCPNDKKNKVMNQIKNLTKKYDDILKIDDTDGVKLFLENGWVLVRPSGTEPMFRVYSESKNKETAKKYAEKYLKIIKDLIKQ